MFGADIVMHEVLHQTAVRGNKSIGSHAPEDIGKINSEEFFSINALRQAGLPSLP
jgi:hypothetical protein